MLKAKNKSQSCSCRSTPIKTSFALFQRLLTRRKRYKELFDMVNQPIISTSDFPSRFSFQYSSNIQGGSFEFLLIDIALRFEMFISADSLCIHPFSHLSARSLSSLSLSLSLALSRSLSLPLIDCIQSLSSPFSQPPFPIAHLSSTYEWGRVIKSA